MEIWKTKQIFLPEVIADLRMQVDPPKQQAMPQQSIGGFEGPYGGDHGGGYNQPAGQQMASMMQELQHNSGGKFRNVSPPRSNFMVCSLFGYLLVVCFVVFVFVLVFFFLLLLFVFYSCGFNQCLLYFQSY
jgi:hypothetical protein